MNMFATQGGVVELWVTKTDTYTSTKTGEIYASVQSIAPIPEGARGNAKGFEISEYNIEPTLLDAIVFEGQPVLCKFASVVRPTQDRFGAQLLEDVHEFAVALDLAVFKFEGMQEVVFVISFGISGEKNLAVTVAFDPEMIGVVGSEYIYVVPLPIGKALQ